MASSDTVEHTLAPMRGVASAPVAALIDAAAITVFALIGRASHEEALSLIGVVQTLWPFLVGCAAGWSVTYVYSHVRSSDFFGHDFRPDRVVPVGLVIWFCTVTVGMIVRYILHQGVEVAFVVVAATFLALFLLGWRLAFAALARRAQRSS
ncbi:DUF3054 domain-containing protein [Gordonia sp. ABSL49_1]|uniref:DUF3054 domain-containing protein n=1 Tax=unclassified Gordonia (in: high G+C Gram-positive bacteria) TaxID=2657482 RepID=UPI001F0D876B|nr:DUF3054 domain-containing protein [Gordonia sp. ABSL49_1]MCH5641023.1 DUF3054 domain-containing protein [Gordonia sp. ABSL49_1]